MIVERSGSGVPAIKPRGVNDGLKHVSRADHWLTHTTQTAWEKSRTIIRRQRVRDPLFHLVHIIEQHP
jgi:hypothetical protein